MIAMIEQPQRGGRRRTEPSEPPASTSLAPSSDTSRTTTNCRCSQTPPARDDRRPLERRARRGRSNLGGLIRTCARCGQVDLRDGKRMGCWTIPRDDHDGRVLTPLRKPRPISTETNMISDDYQNLADRIAGYANRLEPIMPAWQSTSPPICSISPIGCATWRSCR